MVDDSDISILVCTRNRAASLACTLASIERLEGKSLLKWEVVVVDNGSSDHTQAVLADFARRLPLRGVVETRRGLAASRNTALRSAKGRVILVTDDDCLVAADWLTTAMRLLRDDPLQMIGGRVELADPEDLPLAIKTSLTRECLTEIGGLWGFLHGANMAFGREVAQRAGLFDVRFGAGATLRSAEDIDFVYRAWQAGVPVTYEPDLLVHHRHGRRGLLTWYDQVGDHSFGFGAMAMKYALQGDFKPLRALYWDMNSTLRMWRKDRGEWRRIPAKLRAIPGSLGFLRIRNHLAI